MSDPNYRGDGAPVTQREFNRFLDDYAEDVKRTTLQVKEDLELSNNVREVQHKENKENFKTLSDKQDKFQNWLIILTIIVGGVGGTSWIMSILRSIGM